MKLLSFIAAILIIQPIRAAVVFGTDWSPYRKRADSPFESYYYNYYQPVYESYFEDFEDHQLNTPFVTSHSLYESPYGEVSMQQLNALGLWGVAQSVDADDGALDFNWLGDSWFGQVELRFSPNAQGRYPNYAGVVITQGNRPDPRSFLYPAYDVYGPDGSLIFTGELQGNRFEGDQFGPTVATDTFIGFYSSEGISRLVPTRYFAYQIDHLQYGWAIPEPSAPLTVLFAGAALLLRRRRAGTT